MLALDSLFQAPEEMSLSGLSIAAVGDRVVVREGGKRYQVDDGSTSRDCTSP